MDKKSEAGERGDILQEKKALEQIQIVLWQRLIGKFHDGISQLNSKDQTMMLRKQAEASVETLLEAVGRMMGRDPVTFSVDEVIKIAEDMEKKANKLFGKGEASITKKENVITWRGSAPCYDPKIQGGMIKPYHAYCDYCNNYYFEYLFKFAHKRPVKVEGLKSALHGDGECLSRIELL